MSLPIGRRNGVIETAAGLFSDGAGTTVRRGIIWVALLAALPAVAAILVGAYGLYLHERTQLDQMLESEQIQLVAYSEKEAQAYLRTAVSDLFYLAAQHQVRRLVNAGFQDTETARGLAEDFARLARWRGLYEQVRLIDLDGRERLRINHEAGRTQLLAATALQDKSKRDYVRAGARLPRQGLYVSRLELNIEHGQVQRPFHPVLRLVTPLFDDQGERRGMLVLNVTGAALLSALDGLQDSGRMHLWLMDEQGYWLKGSRPEQAWGFMLPGGEGQTLALQQPALWNRMQAAGAGHLRSDAGLVSFRRVDPFSDVQRLIHEQGLADVHVTHAAGSADWMLAAVLPAANYQALVLPIQLRWLGAGGLLLLGVGGVLVLLMYQGVKRHDLRTRVAVLQHCHDMINNLTVGVYRLTEDGRVLHANPAMYQLIHDGDPGEGSPDDWRITHCVVPAQWQAVKDRLDCQGKVKGAEIAYRTADGSHAWLSLNATRTIDERGQAYYDGTALDVTAARAAEQALRISEQKFRTVLESAPDAILISDAQGRVVTANACAQELFTISPEQTPGLAVDMLFADQAAASSLMSYVTPLAKQRRVHCEELLAQAMCGRRFTVEVSSTPVVTDIGHWVVLIVRDVSMRKHAEQQLMKFSRAVEQSANAIVFTDKDARIEYVNRKFCEINEYSPDEVLGQGLEILRVDETGQAVYAELWDTLHTLGEWRGELEQRTKGGRRYWCLQSIFALRDEAGRVTDYVTIGEDISERKLQDETIWRLAYYDALTGLPNRALFSQRLGEALTRADRRRQRLAVIYMDLDGFKDVNDTLGHLQGDALLMRLATRFKDMLRETDLLARLGGDEFAIVLEDIDSRSDAHTIADKLLQCLHEPVALDGAEVYVTTSIGICMYPDDADDVESLVKCADIAMYQGKARGKDAVVFYQATMSDLVHERQQVESRLRRAMHADEFSLHYQPKVDVVSGRCYGAEALLRWRSGGLGSVSPDRFIPIAEETGLITELGEWVLRRATADARQWHDLGFDDVHLGVNVSGRQFRSGTLGETVRAALRDAGLSAASLDIEITETVLVENLPASVGLLKQLQADGVSISIDDFGTGYSSLSSLRSLPIDSVKIDRSFVTQIHTDNDARAIAGSILSLAAALDLSVIAEGVETQRHSDVLQELGCRRMQGYLFAKPMPLEDFLRYLRRRQGDVTHRPA